MKPEAASIGSRLAKWRSSLGKTQVEFGVQLGIHLGQLKKYEQDRTVPGGEVLSAIATTGVNLNWLLTGNGPMALEQPQPAAAAAQAVQTTISSANDEPDPLGGRFNRRIAAVAGMLATMPEQEASALLDEFAARASTQQQLVELRLAVQQLHAAQGKPT
jgi:transcriptional regulator with XRE-family HTH domain